MAGFGAPHLDTVEAYGLRLGIVGSSWHSDLVDHMVERSREAAKACGVDSILVSRVAGSVELPIVAQALAKKCDAVVALGVVIRGETAHFDYVCDSVTAGLTRVALDEHTPVAHGVLTVESLGQARDRAGLEDSIEDKGWQSTVAVLGAVLAIRELNRG
ncbi:6,7-dimethyl-8-ribityllumazine synthase [Actinoplanes sp. NPDC051494]|uniref:6,7-dimethyl-8-ribityllumazine synthase n=1 Tax=Actinoplanes sp. NPDC051494 TaxID=3363907 RepID=UPI0037BB833A